MLSRSSMGYLFAIIGIAILFIFLLLAAFGGGEKGGIARSRRKGGRSYEEPQDEGTPEPLAKERKRGETRVNE